MGLYLLRFFKGLQEKQIEPGRLAEIEILSDVLYPQGSRLTLIQAKRTLKKSSLVAALAEMYLLTDVCRRETPSLLSHLSFQIACRRRTTPLQPADVTLSEVLPETGDQETWQMMLDRFDQSNPIIIEPDSLDQLHVFLWNSGVVDTTALIEECAGRLLRRFEEPSLGGVRDLGRDLAHIFRNAPRRDSWKPVGRLVTAEDVSTEEDLRAYNGVLTGQVPKLEHLRRGFFRMRSVVESQLSEAFEQWLISVGSTQSMISGKVPVFWIGGRSGEGKSVLLLQLLARFVRSSDAHPTLLLPSAMDLVSLIETIPNRPPSSAANALLFAVIDDVYAVQDRDAWDAMIRRASAIRTPPVAIITCGPSEQMELFQSRMSDQFEISAFRVAPLNADEYDEFIEWFEQRTGTRRDRTSLSDENPLLVQLMFELAQGMRMPDFANRFRRRLIQARLFDAARTILAVNALYLDAPITLVEADQARDALDRLCSEDQIHFRITDLEGVSSQRGVRLAHAHLAWLIFKEWVEPPTTLAKGWARELELALEAMEEIGSWQWSNNLLTALVRTPNLSDYAGASHLRSDAFEELYRKHIYRRGGIPALSTLAFWVKLQFHKPELQLEPDPTSAAVAAFLDPRRAPHVQGFIAFWVAKIADQSDGRTGDELRLQVEEFLRHFPGNSSVGFAIAQIFSNSIDRAWATRVAHEWLNKYPENPQAYQLLVALVGANPTDEALRVTAIRWLDANRQHPNGYQLLVPLIAVNRGDRGVRDEALGWLDANRQHPHGYQLLVSLVAANPADQGVRDEALRWLDANRQHPNGYELLVPLVAANPDSQGVRDEALRWLDANRQHPNGYHLLVPLIAANPDDQGVRDEALGWLDANRQHPNGYQLLVSLVAANRDDQGVRDEALGWVDGNRQHPNGYELLVPLVAANPADQGVRDEALKWLDANRQHPNGYQLLVPLVAANPDDQGVRDEALRWLDANRQHPNGYQLLVPLVAANPGDQRVRHDAQCWLDANTQHPQASQLLKTLIARLPDKDMWLEMGERYVNKRDSAHPAQIAAVLLSAGNAQPRYIALALDVAERLPKYRNFLLYNLSRALANNQRHCIDYLNGASDLSREAVVCRSLAIGLGRNPDGIGAFLADTAHSLTVHHLSLVFQHAISEDVSSDELAVAVGKWLHANYRRRGYGSVLGALRRNPQYWQRMRIVVPIPYEIYRDYGP